MRRLFNLLALAAIAAIAVGAAASTASAASPQAKAAAKKKPKKSGKPKIVILSAKQGQISRKRGLRVRVTAAKKGKLKLVAYSSTFDTFEKFKQLTKARRVKFKRRGQKKTVLLRLRPAGVAQVASCEGRVLRANAGKVRSRVKDMVRQGACGPKPIDLSQAETASGQRKCDFIATQANTQCMLPFPNDYFTLGADTPTKRVLNFQTEAMPANAAGSHIDAAAYNASDGYSPGQPIVVKVPGLNSQTALDVTGANGVNQLSRYADPNAPIVVLDVESGQRHPIWTEIDSNATDPDQAAVIIHPAVNFEPKHRYIVAMRDLKDAAGGLLPAPEGFRYYRDELPSGEPLINKRRSDFDKNIFTPLRNKGKIARSNLYLAWDFTVASDESTTGRALSMRDQAFALLGDPSLADQQVQGASPQFSIASVEENPPDMPGIARVVQGSFQVPCFMTNGCQPGGRLNLDASGKPVQAGFYSANLRCMVPQSVVAGAPGRAMVYGHGLLGSVAEVTADPQRSLATGHGFVVCGTDEIGMSASDLANTAGILTDLSRFPQLADRLQQGLLNELYLARLMIHPNGLISGDPAGPYAGAPFRDDPQSPSSAPVIDTSTQRAFYRGNSQGGILGGALMALAPDMDRGALGVSGMNFSVLLPRSIDWRTYSAVMYPSYPNQLSRPLALSLIQILWDRGEPNGYAHRMTDDPLPNTPPHKVLLDIAFGDHQVTNWQADVEARTIGARGVAPFVHSPSRWPNTEIMWGIEPIAAYPYDGSAIAYWDSGPPRPAPGNPAQAVGTTPPPVQNVPNWIGQDPHELPRRAPSNIQMVSSFLQVNGPVTQTCGPCFAGGWTP